MVNFKSAVVLGALAPGCGVTHWIRRDFSSAWMNFFLSRVFRVTQFLHRKIIDFRCSCVVGELVDAHRVVHP
jgi:hypothetical protein